MVNIIIGIILSLLGIGVLVYRIIDSKTNLHWGDINLTIRSILWIAIAVVLIVGGALLIVSHFMGW